MRGFLKDILISTCIAFISFFLIYIINGTVLYNDLYSQGLPFLEFFKNQLNVFNGDLIYNWNIGLGDSTYSMLIYYLLSPFNLILYLFKGFDMVDILPVFMTIKIAFIAYFSSLYFKEILKSQYKWISVIIYVSSYNLIMYGSIHVMWLDTFVFLPIVLLGIEKILKNKKPYIYVLGLFILVVSNYYMAALMIPHIAIYGVIRYAFVYGKNGMMKFIGKMIGISIIPVTLASFVLVPAIGYMTGSSKDINNLNLSGINIKAGLDIIYGNFVGTTYSNSSIHVTIIGMLILVPFYILNKEKKYNLYLVHILILIIAVYSNFLNYIFNLGYGACGGDYRYNIILNIYISILVCKVLDDILEKRKKDLFKAICLCGVVLLIVLFKFKEDKLAVNILILVAYMTIIGVALFARKINKKIIINFISIVLLTETFLYSYYITVDRDFKTEDYAKNIKQIVSYVGEKYGENSRVEVNDKGGVYNTYLSQNILGVEGFHSLMQSEYRKIGDVFTDTAYLKVINRLGGRNIITRFTGERYYVSPYNYCPYINSSLIEEVYGYYVFDVPNTDIKYFSKDSIVNSLPDSMIEKDLLLYRNLYIDKKGDEKTLTENNTLKEEDITGNSIDILNDGEYYLSINTSPENEYTKLDVSITINDVEISQRAHFSKYIDYDKKHSQVYIGYLKKGDKLKLNFDLGNNPKLVYMESEFVQDSIKTMNSIDNQHIERDKNMFKAKFTMNNDGYVILPVVYSKNWTITCNGEKIEPIVVNGGFTAFDLKKGDYSIEMVYKDTYIYFGFGITALTIVGIVLVKCFKK